MFSRISLILCLYIFGTDVSDVQSIRVAVEKPKLTYVNDKYFKTFKFYMKKFNRSDKYSMNVEIENLQVWINNVSVHIAFQEQIRDAVYRPSFIDIDRKFCDFMNNEPYIGAMFRKHGLTCPMPAGIHKFNNMTIDTSTITSVWPFNKARMEVTTYNNENKEEITKGHLFVTFYNK